MAAFSDQSRDSVADYVTSLDAYASPDSADVLTIAWDYFSRQNSLALHTTTPLATLDVGQCAALLPVDFECNGRIRGSGNDGDYINQLQGMEISPGTSTSYKILPLPDTIPHIARLLLSFLLHDCVRKLPSMFWMAQR
jgi:hypothetical protein